MRYPARPFSTLAACLLLSTSTLAAEDSASELRFDLYADHLIVVRGSIGRLDGLRFLIDTGAARTVIDHRIAEKLHLELLPGALKFQAFDEPGDAYRAAIPSLAYGPIHVPTFSGLVAKLSAMFGAGRIDAIVGLDLLRLNSFAIDYRSRSIAIGPVMDSAPSVPFQSRSPFLSVDVTVEGRPVRLMVDTAASRLTLFPNRMQSRLPRFRMNGRRAIPNAIGLSNVRDVELIDVRLERTAWPGRALLLEVPAESYQGLDGVLGALSLVLKRASFDFQRNRLGWEE
jgi:predicted aspartyl protease